MGRTPCCDKNGLKKGPWTPEEDHKLTSFIQLHGPGNWRTLPKKAGLQRCGKSCRLRWTNYLRPDIKRGRFSFEEEETIIQLHSVLGNKWSAIAARLPGRTDNEIKNYWNTHIRKRLLRNGIDPVTHAPRLDLLDLSSILRSALSNNIPSLLNLSGLSSLLNPELLRIASTMSSLNQETQNQLLMNSLLQNQQVALNQTNQFQNPGQDNNVPVCNTSSGTDSATQPSLEGLTSELANLISSQNSQENIIPAGFYDNLLANPDQLPDFSSGLNQHGVNNGYIQNYSAVDSVLSTTLSSPVAPLNSYSTLVNSSSTSTEDERDCSSLLKFEIPESFQFDDFM